MKLLKNKFFILGNLLLLVIAIPVALYLIRQQQDLQQSAAPSSVLSIDPASTTAAVGEEFEVEVMLDPGSNLVSIVDMYVLFDAEKLEYVTFTPNATAFPTTLREPSSTNGNMSVSVNIGANVTQAIQQPTSVGTITFRTLSPTENAPTQISFDATQSRVFSVSETDEPGENVLDRTTPGSVTIEGDGTEPEPEPSEPVPSEAPLPSLTLTPSPSASPGAGAPQVNANPVCTGITLDREATGSAPFSLTLTANGTDSDGTISKVTFNFGDGPTQDVTSAGGIGTNAVSVAIAHTYSSPWTYEATAIITDDSNALSDVSTCRTSITVSATAPTQTIGDTEPTPTIEAPGELTTTIGVIGGILITLLGGLFLLTL